MCCALGVFLFSQAQDAFTAGLCRALIGIGVAFSTIAYIKVAAVWFSPRYYTFVTGLLATATMAGAVCGELPLSYFINSFGWRSSLMYVGIAGFILVLLFIILVPDNNPASSINRSESNDSVSFKDMMQVLCSKKNWLLTLYGGLAFSTISVFGGLWGNPYIQQAYHLDKNQSAFMISLIFIGLGIGSPLIGLLSEYLGSQLKLMFICTLIACLAMSTVLYSHTMPQWMLGTLLFTFGFALGGYLLVFAVGKDINNINLAATAMAMINAGDAIFTGFTEPLIGKILDLNWDGTIVNGVHWFNLGNYHSALMILPVYLLGASVMLILYKLAS